MSYHVCKQIQTLAKAGTVIHNQPKEKKTKKLKAWIRTELGLLFYGAFQYHTPTNKENLTTND